MPIRQRGDSYVVDIRQKGVNVRKSFKSQGSASLYHDKVLDFIEQGLTITEIETALSTAMSSSSTETLEGMLQAVYDSRWKYIATGYSNYLKATDIIKALGKSLHPKHVTTEKLRAYADSILASGNQPSSINRSLSNISVLLDHALETGVIESKPKIPWLKVVRTRVRFFTPEEESRILEYFLSTGNQEFHDFVVVLIDTGMRKGELLKLQSKWINGDQLTIPAAICKTRRDRSIFLTRRAKEALARSFPWVYSENQQRKFWGSMRLELGYLDDKDFVMHTLRHTCASRLIQRGTPITHVQKWMGHASIETTLRYGHLTPDDMKGLRDCLQQEDN